MGEILEKYLSKKFKNLDDILYKCRNYIKDLHYPEHDEEARNCDRFFHTAIMFYGKIEDLICSLPPYKDMDLKRNRLYELLNEYKWLWEPEEDEYGNELDYNEHFTTECPLDSIDRADLMDGKVCRDVGHRKKYADKLKNNPAWNVYIKAYKQHYARFLKKKMSQAEFQKWADFALDMRQKAIDGVIDFEEYKKEMRR